MDIKYTIIIPHYNDPIRLKRLLKSIPMHRDDIQPIVVDDCSPNIQELSLLKQQYKRVEWHTTKENGGAGAARNIGLAHVKGEYLLFADSDDEFIEGAFKTLDQTLKTDADLTYYLANAKIEDSDEPSNRATRFNNFCLNYLKEKSRKNLITLKSEHVVPWAKVYKSTKIKELGILYDETRHNDDVAFNVKCALMIDTIKVVPKSIYTIYKRDESLTTQKDIQALFGRLEVLDNLASELKKLGLEHNLSSAGYLLRSISYGPITFLKVLGICMRSDLKFDWKRLFSMERWLDFIRINREYRR